MPTSDDYNELQNEIAHWKAQLVWLAKSRDRYREQANRDHSQKMIDSLTFWLAQAEERMRFMEQ